MCPSPYASDAYSFSVLQLVCIVHLSTRRTSLLTLFFQEFPDLLEHCNTVKGSILVVGDFNIYVDVPTDPLAVRLSALLDDFGLEQAVTFPTNQRGHTFDLVLHRHDDDVLQSTDADYTLDHSDHYCVVSQLRLSCLPRPPVYVEARKLYCRPHYL